MQANLSIAAGVAGEALIAWEDSRNGNPKKEIWAQCMEANGDPRWAVDGVAVAQNGTDLQNPTIIPNGSDSCAVVWEDHDPSLTQNPSVFCQKLALRPDGHTMWTPGPKQVADNSTSNNHQTEPCVVSDGGGGVIVAWNDTRNAQRNIYSQKLSGTDGSRAWVSEVPLRINNGAPASDISNIVDDWNGGAIVAWEDSRGIYAQRVAGSGIPQWADQGVALASGGANKFMPEITEDGQSGAIVSWADGRSIQYNVYAQRITFGGIAKWTANGVPVCTVTNAATPGVIHPYIASDVTGGGAVVTWHDNRTGGGNKVYAQRVSNDPPTLAGITPSQATPGGTLNTNISGTGFFNCSAYGPNYYPTAKLKNGSTIIWATNVAVLSETNIGCKFNLAGAPVGNYDLYVFNPDGQSASRAGAFTVSTGKPAITGLSSTTASPGDVLTITGTGFGAGRGGTGGGGVILQ